MFQNAVIYYFSGTGNAKTTAYWMADNFRKKGITPEVININSRTSIPRFAYSKNMLLGFCYPTHGFNAPPIVLDFIKGFPKSSGSRFFLINTRAGMKLYKIFTPGLSGLALLAPMIMLLLKGYRCVGMRPLDLPSNWISVHPGLKQKVVDSIFQRCEKIIQKFSGKIASGKKVFRGLWDLPLDIAISPIGVLYYLYGRFVLAKTYFASYRCNDCGICIKNCPVNAIIKVDNRPYWKYSCESCMHCMNYCPERAIETGHVFIFLLWWLAFTSIPVFILHLMRSKGIIEQDFLNLNYTYLYYGLQFGISIWIIFSGYRLMHYLLQFKWINYLVTWTSLTKYKFWRRYKAPEKYLIKIKRNPVTGQY